MSANVFLSWQSDSPKDSNSHFIRNALRDAITAINGSQPTVGLQYDEATERKPGSPNIATEILKKVSASVVFVADITTITLKGAERASPNPNVTFELGYAVAELGWDRVLLCFNDAYGTFPADVPFDFAQHRIHRYSVLAKPQPAEKRAMKEHFERAIKFILADNPKRPFELRGLDPEMVKRERDVQKLRWLLSTIHIPTLEDLIETLPHLLPDCALFFWIDFDATCESAMFHLHDKALARAVKKLHRAWKTAISFDQEYHSNSNGQLHIFGSPGDLPLSPDRQKHWDIIDVARNDMRQAWNTIHRRVQTQYIEIDLAATSKAAFESYRNHRKSIESRL